VERLPLVVAVANNQYAYSTHYSRQFHCRSLADRAAGYGMTGFSINATSLLECLNTFDEAVTAARAGGGPQLVVGNFLRLAGHGEHDDAFYVDPALKSSPLGRDCLEVGRDELLEGGFADQACIDAWTREARDQAQQAFLQAQRESGPDPNTERWQAISCSHLCEFPHP
jgi:pyruvate dehydrogenase E1 component alpha subunit/2-oxoisovalerate dehydrogenase E1 component alpha subunit